MTSCHSKQESQTNFSSPAFSELIHQELLHPAHHCTVKKIIIISWRLLIKVESQGIVILLAQHQISLTVVTGGGAEGVGGVITFVESGHFAMHQSLVWSLTFDGKNQNCLTINLSFI